MTATVKVDGAWKEGTVYVRAPQSSNLNNALATQTNNQLATRTNADIGSTWVTGTVYVNINGTWKQA